MEGTPHPIREAEAATRDGRIGLRNLPIRDPRTGKIIYVSTITSGITGREEFQVVDSDGNIEYWTADEEEPHHIIGHANINGCSEPIWSTTPKK